jgi:hypothetical protein
MTGDRAGPAFEFEGTEYVEILVERIAVVSSKEDRLAVLDKLHAEGWRTTRSGPLPLRAYCYDPDRYLFVGERPVRRLAKRYVRGTKVAQTTRRAVGL